MSGVPQVFLKVQMPVASIRTSSIIKILYLAISPYLENQ